MKRNAGFTLVELMIYSVLFAMIASSLVYFFSIFFKVSGRQAGSAEIAAQANFIVQKIEREIMNASMLAVNDSGDDETDDELNTPRAQLVITTRAATGAADDPNSPVAIYASGANAYIKRGSAEPEALNSPGTRVNALTFTKTRNAPGRDVVTVNLTLARDSANPAENETRQFIFAAAKASAAVFDTALTPGAAGQDIGSASNKWRSLYLGGNAAVDGAVTWTAGATNNSIGFLKQGLVSIDPANTSISAGTTVTATITSITGIQTGDRVFLTPPSTLETGLAFVSASVTAANTLTIKIRNNSSASVSDPVARNWSYLIIR